MTKHKVVHFELPTSDQKRAANFYKTVFGWKIESMGEDGYCTIETTDSDDDGMPTEVGGINGGFYKRESKKDGPSVVIETDDLDMTSAEIVAAGGKITNPKHPIGEWGFMADFTDPDGNEVGLWEMAK